MDPITILLLIAVKAAVGAAVAIGGSIVALLLAGFTTAGVAAGSIAAAIQSWIGCVSAGSFFAAFQSAGVIGFATETLAAIGTVGAAIGSVIVIAVKAAVGAVVAIGGSIVALLLAGFTTAGVAAGSIAAAIQSWIGCVSAGSFFAAFQSAGVIGFATETLAAIGTVGAAIGSVIGTICKYALGGVAGAVVAVGVATCGVRLLGFGSSGIIAGSIAAGIQSLIGSVAHGSSFALMQSAGAIGLAARSKTVWAIGGGIAVVTVLCCSCNQKQELY